MTNVPSPRHLQREGLQEYIAAGVPARIPLEGEPAAFLVIDPPEERISVRVPWEGDEFPDLTGYRHLSGGHVTSGGTSWFEFAVTGNEYLLDAYPILCAVADRVQLEHLSVSSAIAQVLDTYHELLGSIGRLSEDQEVGLYGELLVLEHLVAVMGAEAAVRSWRGPSAEEHDFGLAAADVEVKSTTRETRRHWIGTVTQLQPTTGRPLWVISIQVTSAGIGGRTLPQLVDELRSRITDGDVRTAFEQRLSSMRWNDAHAPLYRRSFRLRTTPTAYTVEGRFPAVTMSTLSRAGVPTERILQVAYQIDLTGLSSGVGPDELRQLLTEAEPK